MVFSFGRVELAVMVGGHQKCNRKLEISELKGGSRARCKDSEYIALKL